MTWLSALLSALMAAAKEWDDYKARLTALEAKVQEHDKKLEAASSTGA